jgi:hypothetical protein
VALYLGARLVWSADQTNRTAAELVRSGFLDERLGDLAGDEA